MFCDSENGRLLTIALNSLLWKYMIFMKKKQFLFVFTKWILNQY